MTDKKQPISFFKRVKMSLTDAYKKTSHYVITKWDKYHSQIEKFTHYTMAAKSATTTFNFSIGLLPILGTILTTLAGVQFLRFLVPEFLYSPYFYIPLFLGIAGFTGYMNYKDQIERAKLDHQILENKQTNEKLSKTIEQLEKTLAANQDALQVHMNTCVKNTRTHRTRPQPSSRELRSSTVNQRMKPQPARSKPH